MNDWQIDGPVWSEKCGHGGYVCSFEYMPNSQTVDKYDLYVYATPSGQSICLRYGEKQNEYMSPGPIHNVCKLSDIDEKYHRVVKLLLQHGTIQWHRNT